MNATRACLLAAVSAAIATSTACTEPEPPIAPWPPVVDQPFPDLTAPDHRGERVRLSSLRGKVLLIEPIGMSCPGCVAFCGGQEYGAFEGHAPQQGLGSLESYFGEYTGGVDLGDEDITVVQMLFFNPAMQTPTVEEATRWHEHFRLAERQNHIVLIGPESIREASYASVPGYWLVDRDFVLRTDSTGHNPRDDLYSELMPLVPKLLARAASAAPR